MILGISVSSITNEFIIHGTNREYDYDYVSLRREEIIETISCAYYKLKNKDLKFACLHTKSLRSYVTTKKEKRKTPSETKMSNELMDIFEYFKSENILLDNRYKDKSLLGKFDDEGNSTLYINHESIKSVNLDSFHILKVLGRGGFGKVYLVEHNDTKELYAMKSIKKDILIEENQIENTLLEKKILQNIDHPFLCSLEFCFQTIDRIYFIMPFIKGGELFTHLSRVKQFNEDKARFYAAQIAMGLDYLHKLGIVYRDLKPENILIDELGYLVMTDFGMSKRLALGELATTFCGTPEYVAPEIITNNGYNHAADWWSFGVLIYEMLCGIPPFFSENNNKLYELIKKGKIRFSKKIPLSPEATDIIKKVYILYTYIYIVISH